MPEDDALWDALLKNEQLRRELDNAKRTIRRLREEKAALKREVEEAVLLIGNINKPNKRRKAPKPPPSQYFEE